jgi:hypothetical protein
VLFGTLLALIPFTYCYCCNYHSLLQQKRQAEAAARLQQQQLLLEQQQRARAREKQLAEQLRSLQQQQLSSARQRPHPGALSSTVTEFTRQVVAAAQLPSELLHEEPMKVYRALNSLLSATYQPIAIGEQQMELLFDEARDILDIVYLSIHQKILCCNVVVLAAVLAVVAANEQRVMSVYCHLHKSAVSLRN